jgi:hypothetical protein
MAIAAVDEVMLREPRLLVPGQKPLGLVKVDPLYRCVSWWMFGGLNSYDTINKRFCTDIVNPAAKLTQYDTFHLYTPEAVQLPGYGRYSYADWLGGTLTPPFSILAGLRYVAGNVLLSFVSNIGAGVYFSNDSGFIVRNSASSAAEALVSSTPGSKIPGAILNYCAVSVDNGSATMVVNGGPASSSGAFTPYSFVPGFVGVCCDAGFANLSEGGIGMAAVFAKSMSPAELSYLSRNPFSPLIPA